MRQTFNTTDVLEFINFTRKELDDVLSCSGSILYSSIDTLKKGKYMIIGLNPGGSDGDSISCCLKILSKYYDNAYIDQVWDTEKRKYGKGNHPLQRNLIFLAKAFNIDLRQVCATNLIFMRSPNQTGISYPRDADICWEVNSRIIQIVQPDVIIAFGNSVRSPFDYLRQKYCEYDPEVYTSGHGRYVLRHFVGKINNKQTTVFGIPHLSRYSLANKTAQIEWLLKKIY